MNMPSRGLLAASAALVASAFVLGNAALRATSAPAITLERAPSPAASAPGMALGEDLAAEALVQVLDADPFQPDRQRPPQRYRLPGDVDPPPPPPPPPPPAIPEFRVSGTAVTPDGGFAMMRIGDGATRVVARGDFLGGYQLHQVTSNGVVMKNEEREVSVTVPSPAAQVAASPAPPTSPAAQVNRAEQIRQQAAQNQRQQQLTPEQARRMAEILERARTDGASPQMLQALQQMIQQRGIDNFMNTDIVIDGNNMRMMQRRPPGGGQQERN